jgi:hypothetical protein
MLQEVRHEDKLGVPYFGGDVLGHFGIANRGGALAGAQYFPRHPIPGQVDRFEQKR